MRSVWIALCAVLLSACEAREPASSFQLEHGLGTVYLGDGVTSFRVVLPMAPDAAGPTVVSPSCGCVGAEVTKTDAGWVLSGRLSTPRRRGPFRHRVVLGFGANNVPSHVTLTGNAEVRLRAAPELLIVDARDRRATTVLHGSREVLQSVHCVGTTPGVDIELGQYSTEGVRLVARTDGLAAGVREFHIRLQYTFGTRSGQLLIRGHLGGGSLLRWEANPRIVMQAAGESRATFRVRVQGDVTKIPDGAKPVISGEGLVAQFESSRSGTVELVGHLDWQHAAAARSYRVTPPESLGDLPPLVVLVHRATASNGEAR